MFSDSWRSQFGEARDNAHTHTNTETALCIHMSTGAHTPMHTPHTCKHTYTHIHIANAKTQPSPQKEERVYSGDNQEWLCLGLPKFHALTWKPYHGVFIVTEKVNHK